MVDRMGGAEPQPVADDIEDMQLTYGLDTNADGIVDSWVPPGAVTPPQIRQVRLQFTARTRTPGSGVVGDTAGARQPDRRNDAGRVSPADLRHRDRCPEFRSVTG